MSVAQRRVYDDVLRTRGNAHGPFLAWLLNPKLAEPAQRLGAFCRYDSSLSLQESELLILHVAAHFKCGAEQEIHEPIAKHAGLSEGALATIRAREVPQLPTERLRLLAEVAGELMATSHLSEASYRRATDQLGEESLVEVVAIIGYYALVAFTLNAFDMRME
ncbi:4-carboxymuconolactone decarboxylase [Xenophilus aerolatus]|nr:4-carboxymuconolactone decarboxylase [Xenophilus aerolatus]